MIIQKHLIQIFNVCTYLLKQLNFVCNLLLPLLLLFNKYDVQNNAHQKIQYFKNYDFHLGVFKNKVIYLYIYINTLQIR
ncbi:hypothetical protein pb186bvf_017377 [Paramecium bursaria]